MLANNNVVQMNDNFVYSDIEAFFNELEMNTTKEKKNTRISYESTIRQFFKETRGKDIEYITLEDLVFKRNDIINYRKHLSDKFGYTNGTINKKIASIKSLYINLEANEYELKSSIFKIKPLKHIPEEYEVLSENESYRFANAVWKTEKHKPLAKYLLTMFAIRTSFRLDEILKMKWEDFIIHDGFCEVKTLGKGDKYNTTSITVSFYEKILELKELNDPENEYVFQVSSDTVGDMMNRLKKYLKIDEKRKVVFHSFRKTAADWLFQADKNILSVSEHLHHNDINTTTRYLNKKKDLTQTPGIRMEEELSLDFMEELTIEDFKEFIMQSDYKTKIDLKNFFKDK